MKHFFITILSILTFLITISLIVKDNVKNGLLIKLNKIRLNNYNVNFDFDVFNQTFFNNLTLKDININILDKDKQILFSLNKDKFILKKGYQIIDFKLKINQFVLPENFFLSITFKVFNLLNINILYTKNELINN